MVGGAVVTVAPGDPWAVIHDARHGLLIERRAPPVDAATCAALLGNPEGALRISGTAASVVALLAGFAGSVGADIAELALRFAAAMTIDDVRLRLEVVTGDACRKWHLDYADVRLVTTYAGAGTDYRDGEAVRALAAGDIALFKGNLYGTGHATVLHRSPPIAGTGARRLVLVIDTLTDRPGITH